MQAHVDVMEALEQTGGNTDTVEEMKLWLLKQKPVSYTHLDVYKRQLLPWNIRK